MNGDEGQREFRSDRQPRAKGLTAYVIGQSLTFAFDVNMLDYRSAGKNATSDRKWYLSDP